MSSRPNPYLRHNINIEVKGWVKSFPFFDEGVVLVRAVLDKNTYYVGETAHIECFVNNMQCTKSIRSIEIKLRR